MLESRLPVRAALCAALGAFVVGCSSGGGTESTERSSGTGGAITEGSGGAVTGGTGAELTGGTGAELTGGTGSDVTGGTSGELPGGTGGELPGGTGGELPGGTGGDLAGGTGGDLTGGVGGDLTGGVGGDLTGGTGGDLSGGTGGDLSGGTGGAGGASACSASAPEGLEVGQLMPEMEVQHCDGTWVSLRDLVCGNVVTQLYSYAAWCPGCRGFSGLEEDFGMTGNDLYDAYHDDGFEQVIVLSATEDFGGTPTAEDCAELQALHSGLVVFDATGTKTQDVMGLRINGGTRLLDPEGLWITPLGDPDDQSGGIGEVITELMNRFGLGPLP